MQFAEHLVRVAAPNLCERRVPSGCTSEVVVVSKAIAVSEGTVSLPSVGVLEVGPTLGDSRPEDVLRITRATFQVWDLKWMVRPRSLLPR